MNFPKSKDLIRVAVVDDDLCACELMRKYINAMEGYKVVLEAEDGQIFLEKLQSPPQIDLVILDIIMPGLDGYSTAEIIRTKYPDMRILFYSMIKTELALTRMVACGGHGVVKKWKGSSQFATAIKTVMGGSYFFPEMDEKLAIQNGGISGEKNNKLAGLSAKEIYFLRLTVTEKPYKEIAVDMHLEERQIDYIRECLFKKLNVRSRVGLAIRAYQSGFSLIVPRA